MISRIRCAAGAGARRQARRLGSALAVTLLGAASAQGGAAQAPTAPRAPAAPAATAEYPGMPAITEADLRRDIFILAGDSMHGRVGGSQDEMRASMWLADRAREIGLEPAGDDGTYLQ